MQPQELARYRRTQIETASPLELVVLLYDGAIEQCRLAREAIINRQLPAKSRAVDRALAIVGELQASLDLERGGELARSLNALYAYVCEQIVEASVQLQTPPLDSVLRVLDILRSGWQEIAARPSIPGGFPAAVPVEAPAARLSVTT